jgi:cytochrome c553
MTAKGILLTVSFIAAAAFAQSGSGGAAQGPQFTADGQLVAPKDYRDWMFLSSGLGMTYGPVSGAGATPENPRFENVFVNRLAYEAFLKTGTWPEHTIFVLEVRSSVTKLSINKDGRVQSDIAAIQAEVKDSKRFPGKWAFFNVSDGVASAKAIPANATCYTCHGANGAVDNTFVQFYPTLIKVAKEKGTFHEKAE